MAEQWGAVPDRPEDAERLPALIQSIEELLTELEERFSYLTSRPVTSLSGRQVAAAGLARCVALLRGMIALANARPDVMGVLDRPLWEAWLVSVWVYYEGQHAVERLEGAHVRTLRIINAERRLGMEAQIAKWEARERAFICRNVIPVVDQKLMSDPDVAGPEPKPLAEMGYSLLFRSQSLAEVHAGLGSFLRYMPTGPNPYNEVNGTPGPAHPPSRVLLVAASHIGLLARLLFREFGLHTDWLDRHLDTMNEILPPHPDETAAPGVISDAATRENELKPVRAALVRALRRRLESRVGRTLARAALRSGRARQARFGPKPTPARPVVAILSDDEVRKIEEGIRAGTPRALLRKWIRRLLEDRAERVRLAASKACTAGLPEDGP